MRTRLLLILAASLCLATINARAQASRSSEMRGRRQHPERYGLGQELAEHPLIGPEMNNAE